MSYEDTIPVASWTVERARVAALSRDRDPNDPDLLAARERLALARVEERVRSAIEGAPPLPPRVERRLLDLIRAHRGEVDAALVRAACPTGAPSPVGTREAA